ncbi:hypothetical protein HMPREF9004_1742 [Schaalia cardiffensis F0333]|uniref:Uncharacterized protein n=1 Tax=Schaalia cardiffensis F0333 TaxID=888050 RepID=N6X325_9ACTO|nr:hypothetical protein HMPREF9004_1742 [Schaalia cardiffensis F0333]
MNTPGGEFHPGGEGRGEAWKRWPRPSALGCFLLWCGGFGCY